MGRRFLIALLSILISGLKLVVNMFTIGISFLTKKDIPMVDDWIPSNVEALHNTSIPHDSESEEQESLKRSIYVVEHNKDTFNENSNYVEWSEYNPKVNRP